MVGLQECFAGSNLAACEDRDPKAERSPTEGKEVLGVEELEEGLVLGGDKHRPGAVEWERLACAETHLEGNPDGGVGEQRGCMEQAAALGETVGHFRKILFH